MRVASAAVLRVVALVSLIAAPELARASGYQLFEQNARGLGSAFAGEAATAEDAGTIFYNPAGLTLLTGTQVVGSMDAVLSTAPFHDRGSTINPALGDEPLRGPSANGGASAVLPSFYLAHAFGARWRAGLGVSVPFGLRTDYDPGWVGRYHAVVSELKTTNLNPTLAVRLHERLALGVGFNAQYAYAKLTNAVDLGAVCDIFAGQAGVPPSVCPALGLTPQHVDGFVRLRGDDWSFGYNAGLLLIASESTRVGLTYRSRVGHTLEGDAAFSVPKRAALLQSTGALQPTDAHARVTFPDMATLAAAQRLTRKLTLLADITWTNWSQFQNLVFSFDNPKQPTVIQPERWRDSFRYALGLHYEPVPRWSVRFGTAYDETPIPSSQFRTPRIPDSDRIWLSFGGGYRLSSHVRVDLGYSHVFGLDSSVRNADPVTGHVLRGVYRVGGADVLGAQGTLSFD